MIADVSKKKTLFLIYNIRTGAMHVSICTAAPISSFDIASVIHISNSMVSRSTWISPIIPLIKTSLNIKQQDFFVFIYQAIL